MTFIQLKREGRREEGEKREGEKRERV